MAKLFKDYPCYWCKCIGGQHFCDFAFKREDTDCPSRRNKRIIKQIQRS